MHIRIFRPHKKMDIIFWQSVFRSLWAATLPRLGVLNVRTILNEALKKAAEGQPVLNLVRVRDDGVWLDMLEDRYREDGFEEKEVFEALRFYLTIILSLLARISGFSLSERIQENIEKIREKCRVGDDVLCWSDITGECVNCFYFDFKKTQPLAKRR